MTGRVHLPQRPAAIGRRGVPASALRARAAQLLVLFFIVSLLPRPAAARDDRLPQLTQPVNDFAGVIDRAHVDAMDRMIRALQAKTGDVVIVATIKSYEPYGDIREYAVKLFENRGRGIGEKGKDNGLLVLLAVDEHRVWIEVGYGLEGFVTDGYAGETSREYMVPYFRKGDYGGGLEAGVQRLVGRIAEARNVTLEGVPRPAEPSHLAPHLSAGAIITLIVVALLVIRAVSAANRFNRPRGWGRPRTWSGWNSGIGPFGGGFGGGWGSGGGGSGGFGGGFGGFGGGGSGGGGGGASW
jgi:uncharacterized protein